MDKFLAKIIPDGEGKKLVLKDTNYYNSVIKRKRLGDYELSLKSIRLDARKRTLLENNYYWGVVIVVFASYGMDEEYWHNLFKVKFIGPSITGEKKINAERWSPDGVIDVGANLTTTEMTTVKFENYLRKIREWGSTSEFLRTQFGNAIFVPLPNEKEFD